MTTPTRTTLGRPADQDQIDQQTLDYEQAVEAAAVAALLAALVGIQTHAGLTLSLGRPLNWLADALRAVPIGASAAVRDRLNAGLALGAGQAALDIGTPPPVVPAPADVTAVVDGMDIRAERDLRDAAVLAGQLTPRTEADLTAVMAKAMAAVNSIKADARWVANRAVAAGTEAVARATGAGLVWVAERDACVVCLALSGEVVEPGGQFDAGATFGDRPMPLFPIHAPRPLLGPPRHPHCRCALRLLADHNTRLPAALRREAQRAVVRGWSNYATEPARLRAADRLLAAGTLLPRTVEQRARRDIRRGAFSPRHNQLLPALPAGR